MLKQAGIGNVGRTPEITYTASGMAIAKFSIGCSVYDSNAANKKGTEWVNGVAFGKLAEAVGNYLAKGDKLYFEGVPETKKYEKDGVMKYFTSTKINQIDFLTPKNNEDRQRNNGGSHGYDPQSDDIPF